MNLCEISLVTTLGFILEMKLSMNLLSLLIQSVICLWKNIVSIYIFTHSLKDLLAINGSVLSILPSEIFSELSIWQQKYGTLLI